MVREICTYPFDLMYGPPGIADDGAHVLVRDTHGEGPLHVAVVVRRSHGCVKLEEFKRRWFRFRSRGL